jgi:hypothetical protein
VIEQVEESVKLQEFLDEVTNQELRYFPDIETDGDKVAYLWDNLYMALGESGSENNTEEEKKRNEKVKEINLAGLIGVQANQLKSIFEKGMPDGKLKKRLDRTFAFTSIFMRIFEDPQERIRNLTFSQPSLHHKTPIQALRSGNIDKVLYFAAMSGMHLTLE